MGSGHTLAAQLGLFEGVPDTYTPDTLAMESMKPIERQAWTWWARAESQDPGSGSAQLTPLNLDTDKATVPPTQSGNKSSVAEKTPALDLIYGFPEGTCTPEHTAYYLRPENAHNFVSKSPQHGTIPMRGQH